MIYYLDDDGEATKVGSVGEKDDAADLNVSPCGGVDLDLGHCKVWAEGVLDLSPLC